MHYSIAKQLLPVLANCLEDGMGIQFSTKMSTAITTKLLPPARSVTVSNLKYAAIKKKKS